MRILQKLVASLLFPTEHFDWYAKSGYKDFWAYFEAQKVNTELRPGWNGIAAEQGTLQSQGREKHNIDVLMLKPEAYISQNKPGHDLNVLNFFGRAEYYESCFCTMLLQAHATGATMYAFNPAGLGGSEGQTEALYDLINDGITVVNTLFRQGIHPDKMIFQGHGLGSIVQEAVAQHFAQVCGIKIRQINTNSFHSIYEMLVSTYGIDDHFKKALAKLLQLIGWEIALEFAVDPYHCYMQRTATSKKLYISTGQAHELVRWRWLEKHAQMQVTSGIHKHPEECYLFELKSTMQSKGQDVTAYDFINEYLSLSNAYVKAHGQNLTKLQAPYIEQQKVTEEHVEQDVAAAMEHLYSKIAQHDAAQPALDPIRQKILEAGRHTVAQHFITS